MLIHLYFLLAFLFNISLTRPSQDAVFAEYGLNAVLVDNAMRGNIATVSAITHLGLHTASHATRKLTVPLKILLEGNSSPGPPALVIWNWFHHLLHPIALTEVSALRNFKSENNFPRSRSVANSAPPR
ncbi:MAG: hypothetical protein DMG06_02925 [Acidobacteria bacterium]|nr:MAG: hypothetical protein DMG06_02925 [Acidobacteriota bacterium]